MDRRRCKAIRILGAGGLAVGLCFAAAVVLSREPLVAAGVSAVVALALGTRPRIRRAWRHLRGGSGGDGWGRYYSD